jgi:hypothetical protein
MLDTTNLNTIALDYELEIDGTKLAVGQSYYFDDGQHISKWRVDNLHKCGNCTRVHSRLSQAGACTRTWESQSRRMGTMKILKAGQGGNLDQVRDFCHGHDISVSEHMPRQVTIMTRDEFHEREAIIDTEASHEEDVRHWQPENGETIARVRWTETNPYTDYIDHYLHDED